MAAHQPIVWDGVFEPNDRSSAKHSATHQHNVLTRQHSMNQPTVSLMHQSTEQYRQQPNALTQLQQEFEGLSKFNSHT